MKWTHCSILVAALLFALTAWQVTSSEQDGRKTDRTRLWQRDGKNVLSGFRNMYNFHVLHESGAEYPFKAWFFGWALEDCNRNIPGYTGCDAIFHGRAKSLAGPWEVYAGDDKWDATMTPAKWRPVFAPQNTYYDEWHNGDPSVVKVGRRYYMAYSSVGHDKDRKPVGDPQDKDGSYLCIMGAVSEEGVNWRRSAAPILASEKEYGNMDAAGDVVVNGSYHRPSLLREDGKFKMWFDCWTTEGGVTMGCAENGGDFLNLKDWKVIRAGQNPCLPQFPNPDIVRAGKYYFAYGDPPTGSPHPWTTRKITEAISENGLDWKVLGYVEPDADAPAIHVPEAFMMREGGETWLYLFYACQVGGEPYDYRYNRIRFMRRKVTTP